MKKRSLQLRLFASLVGASIVVGLGWGALHGCRTALTRVDERPIPPPPPQRIHIAAAGDVMLDRGVWRSIQANGMSYVMSEVRDTLRAADIAFINLECPLSTVQGHAKPGGDLVFCADPSTVTVLEQAGVDVVALANNHSLDAGVEGCEDTMEVLAEHQIAYVGGRPTNFDSEEITYLQVEDSIVAFLAYTDLDFEHGAMCKVDEDMQNVLQRVCEARQRADLVCVSYHWGVEYEKVPTERQRQLGHATIDAGADLILGHHPHVMSGVEWYNDGLILYSMGNFVFDQRDAPDGRMNTAIFNVYVTKGERVELVITPFRILRPEYAPRTPTAGEGAKILAELAALSAELGTELRVEGQKAKAIFPLSNSPVSVRQDLSASSS